MTIIDSHCHLDFPDFAEDLDGVVERARAAGVERMITIGTKVSKAAGVVAIAERYHDVFFTVGTHPHEAAGDDAEDERGPFRRCIVTRERGLAETMIRFVVSPDRMVVPDLLATLPGRGMWLSARGDVLETALARKVFARAARAEVLIPAGLPMMIETALLIT